MQRSGEGRTQAHHKNVGNCRQIAECECTSGWLVPWNRRRRLPAKERDGRPTGTKRRAWEREKSFLSAASHPSVYPLHIQCIESENERERTHKVRLGCSQSALSCAILVMHRPLPLNARCPQQKLTWLFVSLSLSLFGFFLW